MSGGEIALLNLVGAIDRARFTPIVLLSSDGPLAGELQRVGVETHIVPLAPEVANTRKDSLGVGALSKLGAAAASARYVRELKRFIDENAIDLVHTNSLKADILGGAAARLAGRPLIWHVRDRIADDYLPSSVAALFRFLCATVPHAIIANSASTLKSIERSRNERNAVVYSGTNTRARNIVHDGLHARSFGLDTGQEEDGAASPVVGLLGRISPWKGQHVFIRAAATVLKQFPTTRFRIIGKVMFDEADYERQIHALVDELGIGHAVEFSGFRADVATALSELDLLVHASTTGEPFGQVIVEGMAAGLPVVATDGGGVPEIVLHGQTGLLVPMNDADAMAAAILLILSSPERAREMGQRGQARARDVFSIERTARAVEAIYDRLLAEHC